MQKTFSFIMFLLVTTLLLCSSIPMLLWTFAKKTIPQQWKRYMQTDWVADVRERQRVKRRLKHMNELKDIMPIEALVKMLKQEQKKQEQKQSEIDWNEIAILYNDKWGSD